MGPDESSEIAKLRANFEGREAIYAEKGALRVRVNNIRASALRAIIWADVEEIPVPGLRVGAFRDIRRGPEPLRWKIGAGSLSDFSDHCWTMGYGGWSLYFDPNVIQNVLALVAGFPDEMDSFERYRKILPVLQAGSRYVPANWRVVFPAA